MAQSSDFVGVRDWVSCREKSRGTLESPRASDTCLLLVS
jgi:hypothetical protein